jgi:DNA repair ATPase RecN
MEQPSSAEESEATDVIPPNAEILASSQPVTPISTLQHKSPHEEARDELIQALALWNNDHAEAASDMALEAYDDLSQLRRVPNMKRSQIRAEIRQAAELYIEASIKTIDNFVAKTGHSPEALQEAKERLEDLRDVARDYKKLTLMLNNAIEQLTTAPPAHPGS